MADFKQYYLPVLELEPQGTLEQIGENAVIARGSLQSPTFDAGNLGFKLDEKGNAVFGAIYIDREGIIRGGKTLFDNTETGFILGNDAGTQKLYLGNTTNYLDWTGSALNVAGAISASTIDIGGADATSFHVDINGNIWSGAAAFDDGVFKVSNAGVITATSGTIAAWTLGASTLTGGNATLDSAGDFTLGTGNNVVRLSATDSTYRIWAGHATASAATFSVTQGGILRATNASEIILTVADTSNVVGLTVTQNDVTNNPVAVSITQNSTGDILNIFDGATEVFTILDGGKVGIGQSTPTAALDVKGAIQNFSTGGFIATWYDDTGQVGTFNGRQIRQELITSVNWTDKNPNGQANYYTMRLVGYIKPAYTETYTFYSRSDDGQRLWVNNTLLIDNWVNQGSTEKSATIALTAGIWYPIIAEHYENAGNEVYKLEWQSTSQAREVLGTTAGNIAYSGWENSPQMFSFGNFTHGVTITTGNTTLNNLTITDATLTTGSIANFYSNSTDTSARALVQIVNDNASATGAYNLLLQQDGGSAHLRLTGDPANSSPTDGDLWFDGTDAFLRIGTLTKNLSSPRVASGLSTRTSADGSGTVSITGLAFKPRFVMLFTREGTGGISSFGLSISSDENVFTAGSTSSFLLSGKSGLTQGSASDTIYWQVDTNNFVSGGFDLVFEEVGITTADCNVYYFAFE